MTTVRADVVSNTSDASRGFRELATGMQLSSREAKQLGQEMRTQAAALKTADEASKSLARADKTLADAELLLSGAANEAGKNLRQQGRDADEAAAKTKLAGLSAAGAGGGFGALGGAGGMGAAIAAGVALSPILLTVGAGLAGLGLAAYTASKNTAEMAQILAPLKTEVAQFSDSLQPEVLGVFNAGITVASDVLHGLQPVAAATGKALAGVLGDIDAEFRSGQWQSFFGFMERTAGPDVRMLGNLFTSLLADLPPLLTGLQPVASEMITLATGAANAVGVLEQLAGKITNVTSAAVKSAEVASGSTGPGDTLTNPWKDFTNFLGDVTRSIPGASKLVAALGGGVTEAGISAANAAASVGRMSGSVNQLGGAYTTYAGEVVSAVQPTAQAAANLYVMGQNAKSAASGVNKLNSEWSAFLGLSTSLVTAQIGVEGGLKTLAADAKTAGASFTGTNDASQKLQTDFESNLVPGLQNVLNGMRKAGAGTHDLATVLATDLKPATDRGALSNKALEQQIYDMAVQAGYTGPNKLKPLQAWIDRNAGSAQNAANKVSTFGAALAKLPANKTVTLTVKVAGSGGEYITSTTGAKGQVNVYPVKAAAAGWRVPGSGNSDSVPAMLTPGEAVVPKRLVPAVAPILAAGKVPGFAAGGLAGAVDTLGSYAGGYFSQLNAQVLAQTLSSVNKSVAASLAASLPGGGGLSSSAGIRAEQLYAAKLFPYFGWGSGQLPPLIALWNRESGWNANARNPTSGAFGIPQALPASKMGALGSTWAGQILWGEEYIKGRYGSPAGAWAHEAAFGWYDNGGTLKPGLTLALNTTGRAEQVLPAGSGGGGSGDVHVHVNVNAPIGSQAELEAWFVRMMNSAAKNSKLTWALRHSPSAA